MKKFNDRFISGHGKERLCMTCETVIPVGDLNIEAIHHHNAKLIQCIDRKACERRKRK